MGQMQQKSGGVDTVKSTIRSLEDNNQHSTEGTLKQSIVQETTNTKLSGESCLGGGNHKSWSGGKK